MADINYNDIPNIETDWQGYSGQSVQKFIKGQLQSKVGVFYYDATNNRYLVFASEETKNEYILDPTKTDLVLGTFDAPFNYSAEITLTSDTYNAVFLGSTGNYIDFTFDIKNKQGNSTFENVTITYTFMRNAVKQVVTERHKHGDAIHFNVDKYLGEGTNTIMISIVGQNTLAATTASVTYQVVNLSLSDNLDISQVYNLSNGPASVEVPFTVSGYGTKVVEWYIDGALQTFVKAEDEIVDVSASRIKHITLSNLSQGRHSLQLRAYTTINGEKFYTDTLYRDLMVYTGANTNLLMGVAVTIPYEHGVLKATDSVVLYDVVQYVPYTLRFATYSPLNIENTEVVVTINGEKKGSVSSSNGAENSFTFSSSTTGEKQLALTASGVTYSIPMSVAPTTMNLQEISADLVMHFDALGKSNNSQDRDTWTDGKYTATLAGFNYNNTSGWVDGRLEMNEGSSLFINLAPLAGSPVSTGKTIEMEWSTKDVSNDNAVIFDLRGANGVGLLVTATKVSLTSQNGTVIETEYKSDENVRVGFVINRASGVTEQRLSYIYANGILSRCTAWDLADDYSSDKQLLIQAPVGASVSLKSIRVYDAALTADNMLNNYILYRDSVSDMMEVYDRNDIYEAGTVSFSTDKLSGRLPIMIVTGDIPTLENTSDKDTQIVVDIEYINLQDQSKSFKMEGAAMRPQGTSSMGYPKKNFRIYTNKLDSTIVYNASGEVIPDRMYSFKDNAQPVDCWCLKADYAESSGTHNTGIARLWNSALYNAQIDGEYKLRTEAQKAALAAGYKYDVRTTIDGFPILLFYRPSANDELIFIGKYNFNNDKSTESVFGFTGIPGFDNSKMQCWEVLNNGNPLALFTTINGFDSGWSEAFESRYPDTKTPNTADLKAFCQWMTSVSQANFASEKWQHLNVYMMAAYWVYLMRHAAADQFVKNAMFTSEDGQHFYYILYDNDTINGLINTGRIAIKPTDTRQTVDASGAYVFAGHDSRLWNMLEADAEFMEIVEQVDNALYSSGISYINTIRIFDNEQADKWVEKIYNQDARYKYVGPYIDKGVNNLFMLQGKRDLHRRWWLANRFAIYDAKYVSGTYKSQAVELKCINGTPEGQKFTIKAGYPLDYGYGINNVPRSKGISLEVGESHTFSTSEVVNLGDPIRIYGAPNIAEINLSEMASRLAVVTVSNVYDEGIGTKLTKFVMGKSGVANNEVTEISGLKQAQKLEYLDVQGMKNMKSLDLSTHTRFKTLKAKGSSIASVSFAKGAPVESLELPSTMRVLSLEQLPYLQSSGINFEDIKVLTGMTVKSCPQVSNDFSFVYNWVTNKTAADAGCYLVMDNIDWKNVSPDDLLRVAGLKTLSLKGTIVLNSVNLEQINALINIFGEQVFAKGGELYIDAPNAVFVIGRTTINEGESEQYKVITFGSEVLSVSYSLYSGDATNNAITTDGLLTTKESGIDRTLVIRTIVRTADGTKYSDTSVSVRKRVYPTTNNLSIVGSDKINEDIEEYRLSYPSTVNGDFVTTWTMTADTSGYVELVSYDDFSCRIKKLQETLDLVKITLTATLKKRYNNSSVCSVTKNIEMVNDTIAETDAGIVGALYKAGLCTSNKYITKEEAARVVTVDIQPGRTADTSLFYLFRTAIKSFDGFQYFTSVDSIPSNTFGDDKQTSNYNTFYPNMSSIIFPPSIRLVENAFDHNAIKKAVLNEGLEIIGAYAFDHSDLETVVFPSTLKKIGNYAFQDTKLKSLDLPEGLETIGVSAFDTYSTYLLTKLTLPSTLKLIENGAFHGNQRIATIESLAMVAPTCEGSPFSQVGDKAESKKILRVPYGATGYDTGAWLALQQRGFELVYFYKPTECVSLQITAEDVSGNQMKTKIYWTAMTNGVDVSSGEKIYNKEITGVTESEGFPQNTSTTETVQREISFTYLGVTATTTIIQGVWEPKGYTIDLNNGHWALSDTVGNPDTSIYDGVYQSVLSKGVNNAYDIMYIDIFGYTTFKLYIRSYAEGGYDYVMVSQLDKDITGSTTYSDTTLVKAHTKGNQQGGTAISSYTLVEFTGIDKGEHRITIVYRKDSSQDSNDDRGYVLIPKDQ